VDADPPYIRGRPKRDESQDLNTILFDQSTRNRINVVEGEKRKKYVMGLSKVLDFPLSMGKQSKSAYSSTVISHTGHRQYRDYSEIFKVLGWENVEVRAGRWAERDHKVKGGNQDLKLMV